MTQPVDWHAIGPPSLLVLGGVLALLGDACWPVLRRWLPTTVSLTAVGVAAVLTLTMPEPVGAFCLGSPGPARTGGRAVPVGGAPACSWSVDHATLVWWLVVLLGVTVVLLLLHQPEAEADLSGGEMHLLLLASATGAMGIAAAGDLVTLLVSIETVSLPVFAAVGLRRDPRGAEAALKFFLVSVVATAFSLLGIAMVYGATGSVIAARVAGAGLASTAVTPVIGVGLVLTVAALAFKVAIVPFQAWVPDTYVGAPVPVAAYLSVVSKVAGLAGLVIVLLQFFPAYGDGWRPVVAMGAAVTMTVGNLAALRQQNAVRLLAWSSVAQAGYLVVPLAAGGEGIDLGALQSYAVMYAVVNLAAFAGVGAAARWGAMSVRDFAGLTRRRPLLGIGLAFALLCLAGLPPGVVGLVAKVVIFRSAVDSGLTWLAVVMAVNVTIGLVYYLRFVAELVRPAARSDGAPTVASVSRATSAVLALALAAALTFSVLPGPWLSAVYG